MPKEDEARPPILAVPTMYHVLPKKIVAPVPAGPWGTCQMPPTTNTPAKNAEGGSSGATQNDVGPAKEAIYLHSSTPRVHLAHGSD